MEVAYRYLFGYEVHYVCDTCPGAAWFISRVIRYSVRHSYFCGFCYDASVVPDRREYLRWTP